MAVRGDPAVIAPIRGFTSKFGTLLKILVGEKAVGTNRPTAMKLPGSEAGVEARLGRMMGGDRGRRWWVS